MIDATLGGCLSAFRQRFNDNPRVMKLIIGWDRHLVVEPLDAAAYTMTIADMQMTGVAPGIAGDDDAPRMRADEETLKRIFTGDYKPAAALRDGAMELISTPHDREKLKNLAMVIWGI